MTRIVHAAGILVVATLWVLPATAGGCERGHKASARSYQVADYAYGYHKKCWWKRVKVWDEAYGYYVWRRVRVCS
jgi:hypothetical protein